MALLNERDNFVYILISAWLHGVLRVDEMPHTTGHKGTGERRGVCG